MSKKILASIVILGILSAGLITAVWAMENSTEEPALDRQPIESTTLAPVVANPVQETIKEETIPVATEPDIPEGIPVYSQEQLLLEEDAFLDQLLLKTYQWPLILELTRTFPTAQIRLLDDKPVGYNDYYYSFCDLDSGYRVYFFTTAYGDMFPGVLIQRAIILKEELTYSDFEGIQPGSTFGQVCQVDPAMEIYRDWYERQSGEDFKADIRKFAKKSYHYLREGLLTIEYTISGSGTIFVSQVTLDEDRLLFDKQPTIEQDVYCEIRPEDLPYGEQGTPINSNRPVIQKKNLTEKAATDFLYPVMFGEVERNPVNQAFAQAYLAAAKQEGPLDKQDLDFIETGKYLMDYIMPGIQDGTLGTGDLREKIPVYQHDAILFASGLYVCRDFGQYIRDNGIPIPPNSVLCRWPTEAIRNHENGIYTIHDTDSGYRLYMFFEEPDYYHLDMMKMDRFPILIREKMYLKQFASLKAGDSIEKVEAIDPRASIHKRVYLEKWDGVSLSEFAYWEELGYPCSTVHYLADGILKIEYKMQEDRTLVISNIIYDKDYNLTNPKGVTYCYKLDDRDLPWYEGNK